LEREDVDALLIELKPYFEEAVKRGAPPKSSYVDQVVCYLLWAASADDWSHTASLAKLKEGRLVDNVSRARDILFKYVQDRWQDAAIRYLPPDDTRFAHCGLIVDSTTVRINKPLGLFQEAKAFYDGKNHCYGMKVEVGVINRPPYYVRFVSKKVAAAVHDYQLATQEQLSPLPSVPPKDAGGDGNACTPSWSSVLVNISG
jgi:hypothetical protein